MSGEPVSYQPWAPGQPNGGRHQACAEAKIDRETFQGYNDLNCAKSTRCFTCTIKSQQRSELQAGLGRQIRVLTSRFTLRGLAGRCGQNRVDTHFGIVINNQSGTNRSVS